MTAMVLKAALEFVEKADEIMPLGIGLINDTFLINQSLVLQRINSHVFPEPKRIMDNLSELTKHIQQKNTADIKLQVPHIVTTKAGQAFFQDDNNDIWRALSFVSNSFSIHSLNNLEQAAQIGFALGHFHYLVSDLQPELLHDILPNFHIAPQYLAKYHEILQSGSFAKENNFCKEFIASHQYFANDLEQAKEQGLLTLRVIHGDPKLDNFLFDKDTQTVISLIDLDTVKPALVHYDIGDCLRSCCYDKETGEFSLSLCEALLKSYLLEARGFFSDYDYQYLYAAIRLLPFELGLRFYSDYLQGNIYFKVDNSEQNLQRAIEQFNLCHSIIKQEADIKKLIECLC